MNETPKRILVGKILAPHGVRGEVKIASYMENPRDLATLTTLTDEGGNRHFTLKIRGEAKGCFICALDGVTDRNMSETLKSIKLYTPRDALPELGEDEGVYLEDLVGMEVMLADGSPYGHVAAVPNYGASDIIEIAREDQSHTEMYAFTQLNFPDIDMTARRMTLNLPEEL